ncbi:MAG: O-antigen ligase family protein [Candidatus Sumerlaeia bacterium]|nr:O-antigen ligase family protein [Candidatus Sumerlaeia bacterium]
MGAAAASRGSTGAGAAHRAAGLAGAFALALLAGLLPVAVFPGLATAEAPVLAGKRALFGALACVALLCAAWRLADRRGAAPRLDAPQAALLACIAWSALALAWSGPAADALRGASLWFGGMLVAAAAPLLLDGRGALRSVLAAAALGGLVAGGVAAASAAGDRAFNNFAYGYDPRDLAEASDSQREALRSALLLASGRRHVLSTLGNPEYVGTYLAAVGSLGLALALGGAATRRWWLAGLGAAALLAALGGIAASQTRNALLGLGAGGAAACLPMVLRRRGMTAGRSLAALGALAALLAALALAVPGLRERLARGASPLDDSARGRLTLYLAGSAMLAAHPATGVGHGRFGPSVQDALARLAADDATGALGWAQGSFVGISASFAHSDYVEIAAELGLPGLALYLLFLSALAASLLRRMREGSREDAWLAAALLAALASTAAVSVLSGPLQFADRAALFWVAAGGALALARMSPVPEAPDASA